MSNSKTCTIEGCERPHRARGMCTTHRYRSDNGLPMETEVRQYEQGVRTCKVEGCEQLRVAGGDGTYCPLHRRRVDRHGDAGEAERQRAPFGSAVWSEPNYRRREKLLAEYGMTVTQYDAMLLRQNGRCAICGTDTPGSNRARSDRSFCIDHDHKTGFVRGLLCAHCNRGIGMLKDDPNVVEAAAEYLRRHQGALMPMSNASFRGRVGAKPDDPKDPLDADGPGSTPDAEDKSEATNPAGYEDHEKATAAAHAHSKKQAGKVAMH